MPCSLVNASEESAASIFSCHAIEGCNFFQNVLAVCQTIWPHSLEDYRLQARLWECHTCFVSYFTHGFILCHLTTEPFHWHWKCVMHSTKMYSVISRYSYRFIYLIICNSVSYIWSTVYCYCFKHWLWQTLNSCLSLIRILACLVRLSKVIYWPLNFLIHFYLLMLLFPQW